MQASRRSSPVHVTDAWQVDSIFTLQCSKFPPTSRQWYSVPVHNEQKCLPLPTLASLYFGMETTKIGRSGLKGKYSLSTEILRASCHIYIMYVQHEKLHWKLADWPKKKIHQRTETRFEFQLRITWSFSVQNFICWAPELWSFSAQNFIRWTPELW